MKIYLGKKIRYKDNSWLLVDNLKVLILYLKTGFVTDISIPYGKVESKSPVSMRIVMWMRENLPFFESFGFSVPRIHIRTKNKECSQQLDDIIADFYKSSSHLGKPGSGFSTHLYSHRNTAPEYTIKRVKITSSQLRNDIKEAMKLELEVPNYNVGTFLASKYFTDQVVPALYTMKTENMCATLEQHFDINYGWTK